MAESSKTHHFIPVIIFPSKYYTLKHGMITLYQDYIISGLLKVLQFNYSLHLKKSENVYSLYITYAIQKITHKP